ncbi:MAG: hypothetical protein E7Z87_05195 [Cyanobacteria bacterium SIG26]|nr:hypothetical protein [Cyanobacteria bacterium SIG26]
MFVSFKFINCRFRALYTCPHCDTRGYTFYCSIACICIFGIRLCTVAIHIFNVFNNNGLIFFKAWCKRISTHYSSSVSNILSKSIYPVSHTSKWYHSCCVKINLHIFPLSLFFTRQNLVLMLF